LLSRFQPRTLLCVTTQQRAAAKARWSRLTPDERRKVTAPAIARAQERRRLANGVLEALEAAGFRIEPVEGSS
jgi:predicted Fe-S protein YdhL (DUF1289 family)